MKPLTGEDRCELETDTRNGAGMNSPTISIHLLTCAGREAYLAETLASWRASNWGREVEPEVVVNEEAGENIPQRVFHGFVTILRGALAGTADYSLILEEEGRIRLDGNAKLPLRVTTMAR